MNNYILRSALRSVFRHQMTDYEDHCSFSEWRLLGFGYFESRYPSYSSAWICTPWGSHLRVGECDSAPAWVRNLLSFYRKALPVTWWLRFCWVMWWSCFFQDPDTDLLRVLRALRNTWGIRHSLRPSARLARAPRWVRQMRWLSTILPTMHPRDWSIAFKASRDL